MNSATLTASERHAKRESQRDDAGLLSTHVAAERALLAQVILDEKPRAITATQTEAGRAADLHEDPRRQPERTGRAG